MVIIASKRHHVRFFPHKSGRDKNATATLHDHARHREPAKSGKATYLLPGAKQKVALTKRGTEQKNKEQRKGVVERIRGIAAGRGRFDVLVSPFAEKV